MHRVGIPDFISLLNTAPARTTVQRFNHDVAVITAWGWPLWLANPSTYSSCICSFMPVYPGARMSCILLFLILSERMNF